MESTDPVIFIVRRLNELFGTKLTLVDFDEKSPNELLQCLNDVLAEIDGRIKADVRDEPPSKMEEMLKMLNYQKEKPVPSLKGEKEMIYPILFWLLSHMEGHKKRAYLAKFLYPIEVPTEYLQDPILDDKYKRYTDLKNEFKRVHKKFEETSQQSQKPQEIKSEIIAFEDEKKQLQAKIEKLQKLNADTTEFEALLKATKALRLQQDEDARLSENARKQKMQLHSAEERKLEAGQRLEHLRANSNLGSATALLEQLENEVKDLRLKVHRDLPHEVHTKKLKLAQVTQDKSRPQRSAQDLEEIQRLCEDLEVKNKAIRVRLDDAVKKRTKADPKLATSRQHSNMVYRKLKDKLRDLDRLDAEKNSILADLDQREAAFALQQQVLNAAGQPQQMTREQFKAFGTQLREKTKIYKVLKTELGQARAESVTLHRTEHILRSQVQDLDAFLHELEMRRGVSGHRETREKLEKTAEDIAAVDIDKERTLETISDTVKKITQELKEKKKELAPQIHSLKEVRAHFQSLEADFLAKKAAYDKIAVGLDLEREQLEKECDKAQDDALQEESRFHYLNCLIAMAEATLKRVKDEDAWKAGQGRGLLPNFRCYEQLYQNKLNQQSAFADQLRKQRADIEQNQHLSARQRELYLNLKTLLDAKLSTHTAQAKAELPGFGHHDHPSSFGASTSFDGGQAFQVGNANVFQLGVNA